MEMFNETKEHSEEDIQYLVVRLSLTQLQVKSCSMNFPKNRDTQEGNKSR